MAKNTATAAATSTLASSPSTSDGRIQKHRLRHESDAGDDTDAMRTVLAAAIGLTSLGVPDSTRAPQKENAIPPSNRAVAVAAAPQQLEPARKKPKTKTTTTLKERKKQTTAVTAETTTRPPPLHHDQLPLVVRQNDFTARGAQLPQSRGVKMTQSQHPPTTLHFATTGHAPTPPPRLLPQCHSPNSPRPSQPEASSPSIALNFAETLYEILSDPSNRHILSWLPNGYGFVIHDKQLFASQILPRHFDGAKFTSFTRRLKRWKFERVPRGSEMGAYRNKYFVRDRPDLVCEIMYGVNDDEQLNKNQEHQNGKNKQQQKKRSAKNMQPEAILTNSLDGGTVVEATIRVHHPAHDDVLADDALEFRVAQAEKKAKHSEAVSCLGAVYDDAVKAAMEVHRHKLKLQRHLTKESENIYQGSKGQRHQQRAFPPSMQGSSSPVRQLPTPYSHNDYSISSMSMRHHLNGIQVHHQQQPKLLQTPSFKDSPGNSMMLPKQEKNYHKPPNDQLHTSQPGYQEPTKPRQKRKQQQWQPRSPIRQVSSNPKRQQKLGTGLGPPALYNSNDDVLSRDCLNATSPPDNEQHQCLYDIEQQVMLDMSHPMLPTMSSSSPRHNHPSYNSIVETNDWMNYSSDRMNDGRSDTVSDQDVASDTTTATPSLTETHLQMKNNRSQANQEMIQKILASRKNHKEIMLIAASGLQSSAFRRWHLAGAPQKQHQPPHRLQSMQAPLLPSRMQPQFQALLSLSSMRCLASTQVSLPLPRMLPHQLQAPSSPSRMRYLSSMQMTSSPSRIQSQQLQSP